jgi:1-acyl-sn-glycerol-3-phosphate acyltransferase
MSSFITICCAFAMVTLPALLGIIFYPVSRKASELISEYTVKVLAHRFFSILACYKHFTFYGYHDHKNELPEQFFIVSNHQSLIDIPLYVNFFRDKELRFVAKKELGRHVPLVSEILRSQQHCLISRKASPVTAMRTLEEFGNRIVAKKQIPVIFPEGTRSKDGTVGQFYTAGFRKLSETAKLPVVVCALDGGYRISSLRTFMTNLQNGYYRVKIVKIYPAPQTKEDEIQILNEGKMLIQKQLAEWRDGRNI